MFLRRGVVSTWPNSQAGESPLIGRPRLLIQFTRSYPPQRRAFLQPQTEDAPCCGGREPLLSEPYQILRHYLIHQHNFIEMLLNLKCVLWFSLQLLSETFLILRGTERDIIINVRRCSCQEPVIFFFGFWWNFNFASFMKIIPVGAEIVPCVQTW
jgi:hypothetical protein